MATFIPCRRCAAKPGPKPGFYYKDYPATKQKGVVECDCHKQYVTQETLYHKAKDADIWSEAFSYNIDTEYVGVRSIKDVQRLKKYVYEFPSFKSTMVYLYGPNGTQKTTLAHWIGANVIHQGYSVKYLLMQSLLMIISGFERNEIKQDEKQNEIEKLKNVDLLIVDESWNKSAVTLYKSGYQLPFLGEFLKDRVEVRKKGIVFVSNTSPKEIPSAFEAPLQDFVSRNTMKTTLLFEDNFQAAKANFNPASLFD
jgi:DNA replication protein DnaC